MSYLYCWTTRQHNNLDCSKESSTLHFLYHCLWCNTHGTVGYVIVVLFCPFYLPFLSLSYHQSHEQEKGAQQCPETLPWLDISLTSLLVEVHVRQRLFHLGQEVRSYIFFFLIWCKTIFHLKKIIKPAKKKILKLRPINKIKFNMIHWIK